MPPMAHMQESSDWSREGKWKAGRGQDRAEGVVPAAVSGEIMGSAIAITRGA